MATNEMLPILTPQLHQLEQDRLGILEDNQKDIIFAILGVIAGNTAFYFVRMALLPTQVVTPWIITKCTLLLSVFAYMIIRYLRNKRLVNYQEKAKSILVTELLSAIAPQLSYSAKGIIHRNEFKACGIFYESLARFSCEDSIEGNIDGVSFRLAEIKAEENSGEDSYETYFHGPFLIIRLPYLINGETYVLPKDYKETFSHWISRKFWGRGRVGTKLLFSDNDFNRMFRVISNNPDSAYNMLTESFRAKIIGLGRKAYVSFIGHNLYVALDNRRDYLPINLHASLLKGKTLRNLKNDLETLLELAKGFKLEDHTKKVS